MAVREPKTFSGALFAVQMLAVCLFVSAIAGIGVIEARDHSQAKTEQRVQDVAETIQTLPAVVKALKSDDPHQDIQPITDAALSISGLRYISVVDLDGIRVAHVDPARVGEAVSSDHAPIREGREFRGIETGPQGTTFRVKLPITDEQGDVVGTISVGELVSKMRQESSAQVLPILTASLIALVVGSALAWGVSEWVRRKLYGVLPDQVVSLLHAYEAVMESTYEGIVALDSQDRVQLINEEAARLLELTPQQSMALVGAKVTALPNEIRDLLDVSLADQGKAQLRSLGPFSVFAQPARVQRGGRTLGRMVSLRDRSELDRALEQLQAEQASAELLRSEAHEFENRMHLLLGLIELGELDQAKAVLQRAESTAAPATDDDIDMREPKLAALVYSHVLEAARNGVRLTVLPISGATNLYPVDTDALLVAGNLISNAVRAAGVGGNVEVLVYSPETSDTLHIRVDDDGPGFNVNPRMLLNRGTTTKPDATAHGIGLDSVDQIVTHRRGRLRFGVSQWGGGRVEVELPFPNNHLDTNLRYSPRKDRTGVNSHLNR